MAKWVTAMTTSVGSDCMDKIINVAFYVTNKAFNLTVTILRKFNSYYIENYIETVLVMKVLSVEGSN